MSLTATRLDGPLDLRGAAATLAAAQVPSPGYDAEVLAAHVLGTSRSRLALAPTPTPGERSEFASLVLRRAGREPLQHLTGLAPFRHLELAVGPGVFIPRPETEGLVELVLAELDARPGPSRVLDLCAGSGAIAIAIGTERSQALVQALEADAAAFGWLVRNVQAHSPEVRVLHGPVDGWSGLVEGPVDVVVSNPPYLPAGVELDPEVSGFDPPAALWGGPDGLAVLAEVAAAATQLLRPGGLLAVEHDASHQPAVLALLAEAGFGEATGHRDLAGRDRYVTARAPREQR